MSLIPYQNQKRKGWIDPFSELENIQKQMNQMFDVSLARNPLADVFFSGGQWIPSIDVCENKDNVIIKADLPGLKKEEIELSVQEDHLVLKGEKKKDSEVKEENYYKSERFYGSFVRTVPLPSPVDSGKADAKYQDGVLTVTLPKKEEAKPKQIAINVK
jgi:HSP20 family protein